MKNSNLLNRLLLSIILSIASINTAWAADDDTRTIFLDISGCSWYLNNGYTPRVWVAKNDAKSDTYETDYTEIVATNVYRFEIAKEARCIQFLRYNNGDKQNWSGDIWINNGSSSSACCYQYHNYFKLDNNAATVADANKTSFSSSGEYLYFYGNNLTTTTKVQFVMGRWNHYATTDMSLLSNTEKLYYCTGAYYNDAYSYFSIMGNGSSWPSTSKGFNDIISNASDYTAAKYGYKFNSGSTYYATKSSSSKGSAVSIESKDGYSYIPKNTTTLNIKVREASGGAYSNGSTSDKPAATIKITGTYLSGNGTTGRSDATWTTGNSCSYETVISGKVTPSYASLDGDWQFDGWYIGGSSQGTGTSFDFFQTSETTVEARFTRLKYDITLNNHGATSAGTGSVKATYGATTNLTSNISVPSKTGYTFGGYYTGENGTGTQLINASGAWQTGNSWINASTEWIYTSDVTLHAKWTANPYVITLTQSGETGYGSAGTGSVTATYDATMPAIGSVPTGTTGYKFQGYYSGHNGTGSKVVNADGTWNDVTDTISSGKWVRANTLTLYAYFQKAQIIDFTFDPEIAPVKTEVSVRPDVSPTPEGTTYICWGFYSDADCTNEVDGVTFSSDPLSGAGAVTFTTPAEHSGVYYVKAVLRTGSDCNVAENAADVLCVYKEAYVVASDHTVTIKYMCGDAEIAPRSSVVVPAADEADVTALTGSDIFGYTFSTWEIDGGSGISTDDALTSSSISISATYDGTIIARYTETPIVYFKNIYNWTNVYVTYDAYWDDNTAGASSAGRADGENGLGTGNYQRKYHQMTHLDGTDLWYDYIPTEYYEGENWANWKYNIAFNDTQLGTLGDDGNYKHFNSGKVIFRQDFDPAMTVFVPSPTSIGGDFQKNNPAHYISCTQTITGYYDGGYWKKHSSTESGYSLRSELMFGDWTEYTHIFKAKQAGDSIYYLSVELTNNYNYYIKVFRNVAKNIYSYQYRYDNEINITNHEDLRLKGKDDNDKLVAATAGVYTFKLVLHSNGTMNLSVDYPMYAGDYEVMYTDTDHDGWYSTGTISKDETEHITSIFVHKNKTPQVKWRKSTAVSNTGTITWGALQTVDLSPYQASGEILENKLTDTTGVYNFHFNIANNALSLTDIDKYTGGYYIRTDIAGNTKWADYKNVDHSMVYSDYASANEDYTHYYMHWVPQNTNVKFVIANDYSPCISDTLVEDPAGNVVATIIAKGNNDAGKMTSDGANIRFMWNKNSNAVRRAYLAGGQDNGSRFLVLQGESEKLLDKDGNPLTGTNGTDNIGNNNGGGLDAMQLTDDMDWVYKTTVKAVPGGKVKLYALYNSVYQYFMGKAPIDDWTTEGAYDILIGGDGETPEKLSIVYDFKTNRLVAAWEPSDDAIDKQLVVKADIMIVRDHQEHSRNIIFSASDKSLSTTKTIYGVMRFNKYILNNRSKTGGHGILPANEQLPERERNHYYISFPFDVNVSEIFGFGTYGKHWVLQYYDGKARAKNGLWADPGMTYWKYVPPTGKLNANEGYLLALSPSNMAYDKDGEGEVWHNGKTEVELYFPDATKGATIGVDDVTISAPGSEYICSINRDNGEGGDRRIADSYWRCVGVPSFADYSTALTTNGSSPFSWVDPTKYTTGDIHFLYEVDWNDYTLKAKSGSTYNFKSMHAYMLQSNTAIVWSHVNTIKSVVARSRNAEEDQNIEFRLTLGQDGIDADQAFVRMSDDEAVTEGFEFGHDMSKELYSTKAQIYSLIGHEKVAANSLPLTDKTTIVPVGVKIAADGEYTLAMPDGTNGVGVILVDNVTGSRTNLAFNDYIVALEAGTHNERFALEFSPIHQTPTGVEEVTGDGLQVSGARKVMIDGLLYIIRDGNVFDARGAVVK